MANGPEKKIKRELKMKMTKVNKKIGGTQGPRAGERDKGGKKQLMMKMKKIEPIHRTSKPLHKTEFNK
jgi:hypothetical protein